MHEHVPSYITAIEGKWLVYYSSCDIIGALIEMKDNIYWLLAIIGLVLVFSGLAYIFLELRRLGSYGGPTMLLGVLAVFAGMAVVIVADRRGKKT